MILTDTEIGDLLGPAGLRLVERVPGKVQLPPLPKYVSPASARPEHGRFDSEPDEAADLDAPDFADGTDAALAEYLIRAGGIGFGRWPRPIESPVSRGAGWRGMMIGRAAETGVPRCDERVRDTATAADERPGERCRNPRSAPPDRRYGTAAERAAGPVPREPPGVFWRRSSLACHGKCRAGCGCWCGRTLYCAGTTTSLPADTLPSPGRSAEAGPAPCTRSGRWCCAWPGKNPSWGCRRLHGELLVLGVKVAASTVWEILQEVDVDPAPAC